MKGFLLDDAVGFLVFVLIVLAGLVVMGLNDFDIYKGIVIFGIPISIYAGLKK